MWAINGSRTERVVLYVGTQVDNKAHAGSSVGERKVTTKVRDIRIEVETMKS